MIYKIYANDSRFKVIEFQAGLNIILADKKEESGKKDSRNGLGKTTLIHIIHFCFGSDLDKNILPINHIKDWVFFIEINLCGEKICAARSINNPGIIKVQGNISKLSILAEKDLNDGFYFYKNSEWKKLLGIDFFGLPNVITSKYAPSFRNLISYFMRVGIDAYSKPFSFFRSQPAWSIQVHNAFLLGLKWEHAAVAKEIKDKNDALKSLTAAIKAGIVSSKGELEAERVRFQIEVDLDKKALDQFKVHHQYQQIQEQANALTQEIHTLADSSFKLQRKLELYEESIELEQAPDVIAVSELYEDAGLHFGDSLKKTLAEAKIFHAEIVKNRKHFLQAEIAQIKNKLSVNKNDMQYAIQKRAELMSILQTYGALEEFTALQERLLEKKQRLENIKEKIANIQEMSVRKKEIKAEKIELETRLQRDYELSRPEWEKAVIEFNENSQALYRESGNLIIDVSEMGYSFDVEIPRSNSEGVNKMKIYCYDLMMVNIFSSKHKIDFLVHDSTIFDGVDSRQTALALEYAQKRALESGFQYICAFNSNMLPKGDFTEGFNIHDFVRLTLSDKDPEDSLLGFRFDE